MGGFSRSTNDRGEVANKSVDDRRRHLDLLCGWQQQAMITQVLAPTRAQPISSLGQIRDWRRNHEARSREA